jgi:hypothetical protein
MTAGSSRLAAECETLITDAATARKKVKVPDEL